jgi:hypothetical protein
MTANTVSAALLIRYTPSCAALRASTPPGPSLCGGAHVHTAAYAARLHGNRDAPTTSLMSLDGSVKLTDGGNVAADLIISGGGVAVKYNVCLSEKTVKLQFRSTDRPRRACGPAIEGDGRQRRG